MIFTADLYWGVVRISPINAYFSNHETCGGRKENKGNFNHLLIMDTAEMEQTSQRVNEYSCGNEFSCSHSIVRRYISHEVEFIFDRIRCNVWVSSQDFSIGSTKWCLLFHPNVYGMAYCRLNLISSKNDVYADWNFVVKKCQTETMMSEATTATTSLLFSLGDCGERTFSKKIGPSHKFLGYVKNDTIRIVLQISLSDVSEVSSKPDCIMNVPQFLGHQATSDVTISVGKHKIATHKLILSIHFSPVFRAMFENQMQESATNEIKITDFSKKTVKCMLLCLYDDASIDSQMRKRGAKILEIASKYQIASLVTAAERSIVEALNVENAVEYLKFGDLHNSAAIKETALNVIVQNYAEIFTTPNISEIIGHELCNELLVHMVTNENVSV